MRPTIRFVAAVVLSINCAPAQVQFLSGRLTGDQEVPPVATAAVGWVDVRVDPSTNRVEVFAHSAGLAAVAAHLHAAAPGVNGPVILPLAGGPNTWTGTAVLPAGQFASVLAGDTYVNLHTAANPGGEIRAQVVESRSTRFTAVLDGSQSTPPNGSTATGVVTAFLHEPDRVVTYEANVSGLFGNAAHFHRGGPRSRGPIVQPMNGGGQRWCGVSGRLSDVDLQDLKNGQFYVNVHTTAFSAGEIRGQLLSDDADFEATLDGTSAVPPVATAARGEACVTLNADRSVSYHVRVAGLVPTAAHFHRGAVGVSGPVVFPLAGGPTIYSGATPPLTAAQLADLLGGLWYINVHTAANPSGEIRGQVVVADLPSPYGGGCPLNGLAPEIGSSGAACIGAPFDVTLFGAPQGLPAVVLFGLDRARSGAFGRLPLALGGIGATDCFLLHDFVVSAGTVTDGLGCAKAGINLPFAPGFSATLYAQWLVIAPGANPLGVIASNGLEFAPR